MPSATGDFLIPAGTQVSTTGADPVVFATTRDLIVSRPALRAVVTGDAGDHFLDASAVLSAESAPVGCFPSCLPGDALYLGFAGSLDSQLVGLDIEADLTGLGVDPRDPPLVWERWQDDAGWVPVALLLDETGGLCRSGRLLLGISAPHDPFTLGPAEVRAHWLRARLIPSAPDQPSYVTSPMIRAISAVSAGGSVTAEHAKTMLGEEVGVSDGRADQRFIVRSPPVLPRSDHETVVVFGPDDVSGSTAWLEVEDFLESNAGDRHVTWDSASGEIRFGPLIRYPDGTTRLHGAIPPPGARIAVTGYRQGGGAAGNVGAGTLSVLPTPIEGVERAWNPAPARGGWDGESVSNLMVRGPEYLRAGTRAVTRRDYERIVAECHPSIARVRCVPASAPGGPVRVLVVPSVDGAEGPIDLDSYALTEDLFEEIRTVLEQRRVLGVEVEVGTPYYQGVSVAALVTARPGRMEVTIRERAKDALYRYLDPVVGGIDGSGWPYEGALTVGYVYGLLEDVEGVERVDEVVFFDVDLRLGTRLGDGRARIDLDPDALFLPALAPRGGPMSTAEPPVRPPIAVGRRAVRPDDWMISRLPERIRDDPLLLRLVTVFQQLADTHLAQVDQLEHVFDPTVAPETMVRTLGQWIGLDPPDDLPEPDVRRLVVQMGRFAGSPGTGARLQHLLEVLSGARAEIADSGGVYRMGEAPGRAPHVEVWVSGDGRSIADDTLTAVLDAELPASVTVQVRVGDRVVLGPWATT